MEQKPYFEQVDIQNTKKLREMLTALPPFCVTFFRGIEQTTSSRTRIAYAYDLKVFFEFLLKENPALKGKEMRDITLADLDMVKAFDLEEYMEYLKYYSSDENTEHINKERGITRKLSSLKTFYNYFYKKELLKNNPAALISLPKLHSKDIIRLDIDEVASLLDNV